VGIEIRLFIIQRTSGALASLFYCGIQVSRGKVPSGSSTLSPVGLLAGLVSKGFSFWIDTQAHFLPIISSIPLRPDKKAIRFQLAAKL
jgi:hypothetical protein